MENVTHHANVNNSRLFVMERAEPLRTVASLYPPAQLSLPYTHTSKYTYVASLFRGMIQLQPKPQPTPTQPRRIQRTYNSKEKKILTISSIINQ